MKTTPKEPTAGAMEAARALRSDSTQSVYQIAEIIDRYCIPYVAPAWQPIETAPRDGDILLFLPRGGVVRGWWENEQCARNPRPFWTNDRAGLFGMLWTRGNQPTHWQPLPAAPSGVAKEETAKQKRRDSFDLQAINRIVADQTKTLRAENARLAGEVAEAIAAHPRLHEGDAMSEPYYTESVASYDEKFGEGTGTLFKLIDATREISHAAELNGPAGGQLGRYIKAALNGREIADLTVRELESICEKSSNDYNEMYRRAYEVKP